MFPTVLVPLLMALGVAVAIGALHRRFPPATSARLLAVAVGAVVVAALPSLWILSLSFLAHLPILGDELAWCAKAFGHHGRVPEWIGLSATLTSVVGLTRGVTLLRAHRRLRQQQPGVAEVAGAAEPFAFTLPGAGGRVVLSSGLVALLSADEQGVVLAHEDAHARFRHDRYLLMGRLAERCVPILRPLATRLEFSLERWADEFAVDVHDGDRRFVADTLGKVALGTVKPASTMGFAGLGVTARVAALLTPRAAAPMRSALYGTWLAAAGIPALGVLQLHHLAGLVTALCPH